MEKVRYMISDAADMVHVEAHVLRYWEEELELTIPRNEMGHRYYTRENIKEFQRIKELKDQGYQLKAIRIIIHTGKFPEETVPIDEVFHSQQFTAEERMSQFRELMSDIVGHAIAQNNEELSQSIGKDVEERILKEMNYLMREQDSMQEERYRKLDAAIRGKVKKKPLFFKEEVTEEKKNVKNKGKHHLGFSKA